MLSINLRVLSNSQAKKALPFLAGLGIDGLHKDSREELAEEHHAAVRAYQEAESLPGTFLQEEED